MINVSKFEGGLILKLESLLWMNMQKSEKSRRGNRMQADNAGYVPHFLCSGLANMLYQYDQVFIRAEKDELCAWEWYLADSEQE